MSLEAWELVRARDIPTNTKVVDFKFVFKTKTDEHGKETKKKARLVARGFMEDTTGQLTFAPVSAYSTLWTVLAVSAAQDHVLEYADIKSAYLLAELPEDHHVYMHVPSGIKDTGAEAPMQVEEGLVRPCRFGPALVEQAVLLHARARLPEVSLRPGSVHQSGWDTRRVLRHLLG